MLTNDDKLNKLLLDREKLIAKRSKILESPLFVFNTFFSKRQSDLDDQISLVDKQINILRKLIDGKKIVHASCTNLRFYEMDGWEKALLEPYLINGNIIKYEVSDQTPVQGYFSFELGSKIDYKSLYFIEIAEIKRLSRFPQVGDLEFIELMLEL